jgi:hypothetical protein
MTPTVLPRVRLAVVLLGAALTWSGCSASNTSEEIHVDAARDVPVDRAADLPSERGGAKHDVDASPPDGDDALAESADRFDGVSDQGGAGGGTGGATAGVGGINGVGGNAGAAGGAGGSASGGTAGGGPGSGGSGSGGAGGGASGTGGDGGSQSDAGGADGSESGTGGAGAGGSAGDAGSNVSPDATEAPVDRDCVAPLMKCHGACVDTTHDTNNCGASCRVCPFGADCAFGVCV